MFLQMIFTFAALLALLLIGVGPQFDNPYFMLYGLVVAVLSPIFSLAIMSAIAWVADWGERRARSKRRAAAAARRLNAGQ